MRCLIYKNGESQNKYPIIISHTKHVHIEIDIIKPIDLNHNLTYPVTQHMTLNLIQTINSKMVCAKHMSIITYVNTS